MDDKFQNRYRIKSTRLQNWDYSWNGLYFITICTKDRICFFGDIIESKVPGSDIYVKNGLSEIGKIAEKYWLEIPQHFSFVKLDAFVIMPNHVHGIIVIDHRNDKGQNHINDRYIHNIDVKKTDIAKTHIVETPNIMEIHDVETPKLGVSTTTMENNKQIGGKNEKWKSGTLGSIINQYKRICTINARKINPDFAWQSRFYDHIIRDKKSYQNIVKYIIDNPLKWKNDKFYSINKNDGY
jgi:REP element-mobilizing transposase RayT